MKTLSPIDTQQLNQGIQQLYALNNFATFGLDVLTIVDQLVPSEMPLFHSTNVRTREISLTLTPNSSSFPPGVEMALLQHFEEHPITQNIDQARQGAHKVSDFISQKKLHDLEGIYQQFLRPLEAEDQMMLFLPYEYPEPGKQLENLDVIAVGFALNRPKPSFTDRDRLILNLLRPHIFQAYQNAQKYSQAQHDLGDLKRSIQHQGLVIVARSGQIRWATPPATRWLETYFGPPTIWGNLPEDLRTWMASQIQDGTEAIHRPMAPLYIERATAQLVIRLMREPTDAHYTLILEVQSRSPLAALTTLGLSQRETEVLGWLMQGKDNKSIATQMAVGASTIRKHLESIYRKLNVQSRTEAVAQALRQLGRLADDR
jgi:DNA-binding CsgD family transcriptional regulator